VRPFFSLLVFTLNDSYRSARPRDRAETPPSPTRSPNDAPMTLQASPRSGKPHVIISRPTLTEADHEDFSRRLKISNNSSSRNHASSSKSPKLFNPESDSIPVRRAGEPESISDTDSYSRGGHAAQRQLFNHRKDDPVRFAVLARPSASNLNGRAPTTPKSCGDYVSTSSASEYAQSSLSSNFTLSSNTDTSSASSALFERERKEPGNNAFAGELKKLYRSITTLEGKIAQEDSEMEAEEEGGRIMLQTRGVKDVKDEDAEQQKWRKVISDHKRCVFVEICIFIHSQALFTG
jgi:protein SMG6